MIPAVTKIARSDDDTVVGEGSRDVTVGLKRSG
jgi:hypothetical protein